MIRTRRALMTTFLTDGITPTTGYLDGAELALLQGTVPDNPGAVFADVTEADFTGYARVAIAEWAGPGNRTDGLPFIETDDCVFQADDPITTANTITGWAIMDGSTMLHWGDFDEPVVVDTASQIVIARGQVAIELSAPGYGDAIAP